MPRVLEFPSNGGTLVWIKLQMHLSRLVCLETEYFLILEIEVTVPGKEACVILIIKFKC